MVVNILFQLIREYEEVQEEFFEMKSATTQSANFVSLSCEWVELTFCFNFIFLYPRHLVIHVGVGHPFYSRRSLRFGYNRCTSSGTNEER